MKSSILKSLISLLLPLSIAPLAAQESEPAVVVTTEGLWNTTTGVANWVTLLDVDYEFGLWQGASFRLDLLAVANLRQEQHKSGVADNLHIFSAIEDSPSTLSLMTFGIGQHLHDGQWRLFFGIRDLGKDYFTTPWNAIFTSSMNGLYPSISTNFVVADAPNAAMALHAEWHPTKRWAAKLSLYDGVASSEWNELFRLNISRDGLFAIGEVGYSGPDNSFAGNYRLGATFGYAPTAEELAAGGHHKSRRASLWFLGEQPLYKGFGGRAVEMVLHAAWAPQSDCHLYGAAAVVCKGVLSSADHFGLLLGRGLYKSGYETLLELTYSYRWHSLTLQPAIHRVFASVGRATVAMLKLTVEL